MEELRKKLDEWREAFKSEGIRVNLGKTKLMVSGMEEETLDSKIDPCGKCKTRVMSNLMLCTSVQNVENGFMQDAWIRRKLQFS